MIQMNCKDFEFFLQSHLGAMEVWREERASLKPSLVFFQFLSKIVSKMQLLQNSQI